MYEEREQAGFDIRFKILPLKAGFVRIWAEVSIIALIIGAIVGKFQETAGTVMLIWLGVGLAKFLLKLFPPSPKKKEA